MKTINVTDFKDKVFFTADQHFGHFGICKPCNRPFKNKEEMDNALIKNWNKVVPKDGVVIVCGDLMVRQKIQKYDQLASKLNGTIYLVRGNHDLVDLRDEH